MVNGGRNGLMASSLVWVGVIVVLLLFEKVKKIHPVGDKPLEEIIGDGT